MEQNNKKITLNKTEYIVLKYIAENTQFKFIGRDFAGVWVYKDEPMLIDNILERAKVVENE